MSFDITKRGSLQPFIQSEVFDYDPSRGWIVRREYKGASRDYMLAAQQDLVRAGIACRMTYHQGGTAGLELEDPNWSYTIDKWEIVGNEEARTLWDHPSVTLACTADQIAALASYASDNTIASEVFADPRLSALAGTSIERRYTRAVMGQEYRKAQYVLRHTTNAPARWGRNIADFGVDNIYTTAQLLTEASDHSLWFYPMPYRLQYKLASIPVPTYQANYLWGWLKSAATETTAANNRVDIATEYTLEQWSLDDYPAY